MELSIKHLFLCCTRSVQQFIWAMFLVTTGDGFIVQRSSERFLATRLAKLKKTSGKLSK